MKRKYTSKRYIITVRKFLIKGNAIQSLPFLWCSIQPYHYSHNKLPVSQTTGMLHTPLCHHPSWNMSTRNVEERHKKLFEHRPRLYKQDHTILLHLQCKSLVIRLKRVLVILPFVKGWRLSKTGLTVPSLQP